MYISTVLQFETEQNENGWFNYNQFISFLPGLYIFIFLPSNSNPGVVSQYNVVFVPSGRDVMSYYWLAALDVHCGYDQNNTKR